MSRLHFQTVVLAELALTSDIFLGQIGPFINIYSRRTVLNGPIPIKSSLNRGDIFTFKIYNCR